MEFSQIKLYNIYCKNKSGILGYRPMDFPTSPFKINKTLLYFLPIMEIFTGADKDSQTLPKQEYIYL